MVLPLEIWKRYRFNLPNFYHLLSTLHFSKIEDLNLRHCSLWRNLLIRMSNGTGLISRDVLLEKAVEKAFFEVFQPMVQNGTEIFGSKLDPVRLFPVGPVEIKKRKLFKIFRGELSACDIHLHNLKNSKILSIEVKRNEALTVSAVRFVANLPIVWMTGSYQVTP